MRAACAYVFRRVLPLGCGHKKVVRSIRGHRELILNWFKAKKEFNSGIVEGLNYKIKLTIRKAYGYRELKVAEVAIYHALGQLPEPELTHRFC